ncbi:hypothetical protein [Hyphomicrobium nitrativorans]|uniref:hypothetical protein n=1 Tax=Hyphomicrobium nitrativorans TaxID=1427356 RepID=UPI000AE2BFF1|nr:hypothetical protein [Hyphomicrobium nitrativorans]
MAITSFVENTAAKTGQSERKVRRDAARARLIPKIAEVVGTSLDKGDELDALVNLPDEKQSEVIARAKAGERVSAHRSIDRRSFGNRRFIIDVARPGA